MENQIYNQEEQMFLDMLFALCQPKLGEEEEVAAEPEEEWRIVEDAPQYEVSNLGRVRHIKRKKIRKPQDCGGYQIIGYKENGKLKNFYVHIAVAKAFVPNPDNKPEVSHLDESRDNNRASNLTWATPKENSNMPLRRQRMSAARGYPCRCIETGEEFISASEAARQMGLWSSAIVRCCNGQAHTTGGYHFEYIKENKK